MPRFLNDIDASLNEIQNVVLDTHHGASDPDQPPVAQLWFNPTAGADGQGRPKVRLGARIMVLDDQYVTTVSQGDGIVIEGTTLSPVVSLNLSGTNTLETVDGALRIKSASTAGAPLLSAGEGNEATYGPLNLAGGTDVVTGVLPVERGGTGVATVAARTIFAGPLSADGAPGFRALSIGDLPGLDMTADGSYWIGDWDVEGYPTCLSDYWAPDNGNGFWIVVTAGDADDGQGNTISWEVGDYVKSVFDDALGDFMWKKVPVSSIRVGYGGLYSVGGNPDQLSNDYPPRNNPGMWLRVQSGGVADNGLGQMVTFPSNSWANCDGISWSPVSTPNSVTTVFGRVGDIVPQDDYNAYYAYKWHTHPVVSDPAKADVTWVESRAQNLVSNGNGFLKNNTNFSSFTFDGTDGYYSVGSFKRSVFNTGVWTDEPIIVDVNQTYRLSVMAKSNPHVAGAHAYFGIIAFDADDKLISAPYHMYQANTLTTLAADLKNGDTVIQLTSAANWNNSAGANTHFRGIIVWNYVNSLGYAFPPLTYSRNSWLNLYDDGAISGNTITLRVPWTGGLIPAGTQLSNSSSGGTYKYIAASNVDVPGTWTPYTGTIGGADLSGTNVNSKFPPGTAYVRVLFLMNRDVPGNTTWVTNVTFGLDVPTGILYIAPGTGTTIKATTGTYYDFSVYTPGGTAYLYTPTGTTDLKLTGTFTATGALIASGSVSSGGSVHSSNGTVDAILSYSGVVAVVGTASNHPIEVWTAGVKRASFDTTGLTMVTAGAVTTSRLNMNRMATASTGQKWWNATYKAWQTYVGQATTTGQGYDGDLTAPAGTYVTSWALRSFIENVAGYGWTWESGASGSTTPSVVAELSSASGNFRTVGTVTATGLTINPAAGVGQIIVSPGAGTASLVLAGPAGQASTVVFKNAGVVRAQVWVNSDGATFALTSFDTNGSSVGDVLQVPNTAGGTISILRPVTVTGDLKATNHVVAAGNGNGLGLWGGASSYSIYMSDATDATYGGRVPGDTASDYNMYFKMSGATRGFVFRSTSGIIAGIDSAGNGYYAGAVTATRFNGSGAGLTAVPAGALTNAAGGILDTGGGQSWISQKTDPTVLIRESNTQNSGGSFRAFIQSTNLSKTFVLGRLSDSRFGLYVYLNTTVTNTTDGGLWLDGVGNTTASGTVTANGGFIGSGSGLTGTAASLSIGGTAGALKVTDTRNDNSLPGAAGTTYQLKADFKIGATVGLPAGTYYAGVQTFTPYTAVGATGGGPAYQMAYMSTSDANTSGSFSVALPRLLVRNGIVLSDTSTGAWNPWYDVLLDTQQTLSAGKTWAMPNLTGLQVVNTGDGLTASQADTARYAPLGVTRKADAVNTLAYVGLTRAGVFPGAIGVSKDNEIVLGQATATTQVMTAANSWLKVGSTGTTVAGALTVGSYLTTCGMTVQSPTGVTGLTAGKSGTDGGIWGSNVDFSLNNQTYKFLGTGMAGGVQFASDGSIRLLTTAVPGTAGAALTWTEAMILGANGGATFLESISSMGLFVRGTNSEIAIYNDAGTLNIEGGSVSLQGGLNSYGGIYLEGGIEVGTTGGAGGIHWPGILQWCDYATNAGGLAPNNSTPPAFGGVTSSARRFSAENTAGMGWVWESGASGAGASTGMMALTSDTGNLTVAGCLEAKGVAAAGGLILTDDLGNRYRLYLLGGALKMQAL